MLATITTDLDKIAPRFEIQPEQIQILKTPAEFYETLKVGGTLHMSLLIPDLAVHRSILFPTDSSESSGRYISCIKHPIVSFMLSK